MAMRKRLAAMILVVVCAAMMLTGTAFGAVQPGVTAQSAILTEASTGQILYEKNADERIYPASMTKVLTALVATEYFQADDVIVVGREINEVSLDSSKAGHIVGESITFRNLLRGLMIPSGNDSAEVIACAVARKAQNNENLGYEQCQQVFADLMNEKAASLGCTGSHFANPHGYHDENHYTTAADLAKIAAQAIQVQLIADIAKETAYDGNSMENQNADGLITQQYHWTGHNMLIENNEYAYPYATGLKTGFTDQAGDCVLGTAQKDGISLIAVICNSPDPGRWIDAATLFNYGFDNFSFATVCRAGDVVGSVGLRGHRSADGDLLDLVVQEDVTQFMDNETAASITPQISLTNEEYLYHGTGEEETDVRVKAPVTEGTELGTVSFTDTAGNVVATAPVYAARTVEEAGIGERILDTLASLGSHILTLQGLIVVAIIVVAIIVVVLIIILKLRRRRYSRSRYHFSSRRGRGRRRF